MAKIINKRNVIGDRFKEAVASLISFTPTTTITGTNVQAALEELDSHVLASAAISDDGFEETTEIPRDADTLCGVDGNQIISELTVQTYTPTMVTGAFRGGSIIRVGSIVVVNGMWTGSLSAGTETIVIKGGIPVPKTSGTFPCIYYNGASGYGGISEADSEGQISIRMPSAVSNNNVMFAFSYECKG